MIGKHFIPVESSNVNSMELKQNPYHKFIPEEITFAGHQRIFLPLWFFIGVINTNIYNTYNFFLCVFFIKKYYLGISGFYVVIIIMHEYTSIITRMPIVFRKRESERRATPVRLLKTLFDTQLMLLF